MKFPTWKLNHRWRDRWRSWLVFAGVAYALLGSGVVLLLTFPQPSKDLATALAYPAELRLSYASLVQEVRTFEAKQGKMRGRLVSDRELEQMLSRVQLDAASGQFHQAKADIVEARRALGNWNLELAGGSRSAGGGGDGIGRLLPIVLYHYTPANFEQQLTRLEQHGYTTIPMDEAVRGLQGGELPAKPVVLTFDDGFANQWQAFEMLKRHGMRATFYIIAGGAASHWCIGAGRRYGDPLQPPGGCGDTYLTWDQVRALDASGVIEIGGHTVNHRNLASLSADEQRFEIAQGKAELEGQLGHPVWHFAYPYGAYNELSIQIAREAGYVSAVTTAPGDYQAPGSLFTLRRVRDTLSLP